MEKVIINQIFELMLTIGAVTSESEFSRDWLGRSECYLRTVRFNGTKPSVGSLAICASKLQHYGKLMMSLPEHAALGNRFLELSQQCHEAINHESRSKWLA